MKEDYTYHDDGSISRNGKMLGFLLVFEGDVFDPSGPQYGIDPGNVPAHNLALDRMQTQNMVSCQEVGEYVTLYLDTRTGQVTTWRSTEIAKAQKDPRRKFTWTFQLGDRTFRGTLRLKCGDAVHFKRVK
jgi:hypothetical protein